MSCFTEYAKEEGWMGASVNLVAFSEVRVKIGGDYIVYCDNQSDLCLNEGRFPNKKFRACKSRMRRLCFPLQSLQKRKEVENGRLC